MKKIRFKDILVIVVVALIATAIMKRCSELTREEVPTGYETLTVHTGDTLWGIAEIHCPDTMDKRRYIRAVCDKNRIGADIYPGMEILVPVYE
ncbi:MAG: LysM peptidoglycan-binding domain-containing protein [Lachnospiraceae bacterium]